jgi:hypothetical protein
MMSQTDYAYWQTFCESCARWYAVEEGYAFEEEIGDSLELETAR